MKKAVLSCVLFVLVLASQAGAATILLDPGSLSVTEGSTFSVDLKVSGVSATTGVGGFDIDVLYDPTQVALESYFLGAALRADGVNGLDWSGVFDDLGRKDLAFVSLADPLVPASSDVVTLATLAFRCLGPGRSLIAVDGSDPLFSFDLVDAGGSSVQVTIGNPLELTQTSGGTTVPEPGSMALLAGGLVALAGTRRWISR